MTRDTSWIPLGLILILGGVLLFANLDLYDIWGDEALTFPKGNNVGEVIEYTKLVGGTVHPPIYSLLQFSWMKVIAGWDTALNRSLYAFFGLLSLLLVYLLGRELFNRNVAIAATLLCALSPFLVQYSRMVRYYSLTTLLALLTIWFFFRCKRTGRWSDWGLFTLSGALFIYEDYLAVFVLFFMYLYLFINFKAYRDRLVKLLLSAAVIFILFLPWLPIVMSQVGGGYDPYPEHLEKVLVESPRIAQKEVGIRGIAFNSALKMGFLGYVFTLGETTYFWRWWITIPAVLSFAALFILAIVRRSKPGEGNAGPLAFLFLCTLLVTVVLSEIYGIFGSRMFQFPSKVMFLSPLFLLLVARGWTAIRSRTVQIIAAVLILAGNAYGLNNYYSGRQFLNPKFLAPWGQIQSDIEAAAEPQDLILTDEEAFAHQLKKVSNCPIEDFGLVGAVEKVEQILTERGSHDVFLVIRYRGDETIVMEGLRVRDELDERHTLVDTWSYVPADPEAASYWKSFLGRKPHPYLVDVYRFGVETAPEESSMNE